MLLLASLLSLVLLLESVLFLGSMLLLILLLTSLLFLAYPMLFEVVPSAVFFHDVPVVSAFKPDVANDLVVLLASCMEFLLLLVSDIGLTLNRRLYSYGIRSSSANCTSCRYQIYIFIKLLYSKFNKVNCTVGSYRNVC
jgi:hypothetical protein